MYEKGELDVSVPQWGESMYCTCDHGADAHQEGGCIGVKFVANYPIPCKHKCLVFERRQGAFYHRSLSSNAPKDRNVAYLPHSCDEWVIGGKEEVEAMIADLQEILEKL